MDITIKFTDDVEDVDKISNIICEKLCNWNKEKFHKSCCNFSIYVEINEAIVGGISCAVFCGTMVIEWLFLPEECRNLGIGKKIIKIAEEKASTLGASSSFVWTMDFQAIDFYERRGFKKFSTMQFGDGSVAAMLSKSL